jgi:protein TonB
VSFIRRVLHLALVVIGAAGLTLAFFLVLPLLQSIITPNEPDIDVRPADIAKVDDEQEEIEEIEPPPEEPPKTDEPQLTDEAQSASLDDLTRALYSDLGGGYGNIGGGTLKIDTVMAGQQNLAEMVQMSDLDEKPRPLYQEMPRITQDMRGQGGGTVYVIFIVSTEGRVQDPVVQKSSNPLFNEAALSAIKRWRFEPGKRNGRPVSFRMRVPITFPES